MSSILWVLISFFLMCLLTSKTKQEEKFYKRRQIQNIVRKYKISAEIIGSLFLIVLCALILLALYQSGGCVVIAIFLSSVYTLLLMSCVAIVVYVLCKINEHWNPDELYLVIAIRGNMSYRRLKQVHFFLLGMAFSGFVYSNIYLILNM